MSVQLGGRRSAVVILAALSFMAVILSISTVQAFSADSKVGDIYMVSTVKGKAWAKVDGEIVEVPVTVELVCKVTETLPDVVLFRPVMGTIVLNNVAYHVNQAWWRGIYFKYSERALIEGSASNDEGNTMYFIIHAKDKVHTQGGTLMKAIGGIRDLEGIRWKTELILWRYKFGY